MKKKKIKGVSRTVSAIKKFMKMKKKTNRLNAKKKYCIMQKNRGWTTLFLVEYKKAFFQFKYQYLERQKN